MRELKDMIKINDINIYYFVFRQYSSCIDVIHVKDFKQFTAFRPSTSIVHAPFYICSFTCTGKSLHMGEFCVVSHLNRTVTLLHSSLLSY
jgi:hypothetical protein